MKSFKVFSILDSYRIIHVTCSDVLSDINLILKLLHWQYLKIIMRFKNVDCVVIPLRVCDAPTYIYLYCGGAPRMYACSAMVKLNEKKVVTT